MKKLFISMFMVLITSFSANAQSGIIIITGKGSYYDGMNVFMKVELKFKNEKFVHTISGPFKVLKNTERDEAILSDNILEYIDVQIYDPKIDNESSIIKTKRIKINKHENPVEKLHITFFKDGDIALAINKQPSNLR